MARPADPHRRETILRAAAEVFTEQGFSDTRLVDIAQRAGVVISTLYLYFASKEDMVRAIARETQQILFARLKPVLMHLQGEEDIAQFVEIIIAFAKEHRDQIIVFNLDNGLSTIRRGSLRGTGAPQAARGIEVINRLIAEGVLQPYDPELVMAMLNMVARWIINKCLALEEDDEERLKKFCVQWLSQALLTSSIKSPGIL